MAFENSKDEALKLIRTFGTLTKEEIKMYFKRKYDSDPENIERMLASMKREELIFTKDNLIKFFPYEKIDIKMICAFWAFLGFCREAEDRYFKASYPSQIGFVTDRVYAITVCEDPNNDSEMLSLKIKENDDAVIPLIVGVNMKHEDIRKEILPTKDYIFAEMQIENVLTDMPKIRFVKVTKK